MPHDWRSVSSWTLLGSLALAGASGGALWIYLSDGVIPGVGPGSSIAETLYAWWVPGLLIGLAFTATLRFEPHTALAFSTLTGTIYFGCTALSLVIGSLEIDALLKSSLRGAVAGGLGALLFHRTVLVFLGVPPRTKILRIVTLGALLGWLLITVLSSPDSSRLAIVLASASWAGGVGFASFVGAVSSMSVGERAGTGITDLRAVLGGPIVQAFGLLVTFASVVSLLAVLA